MESQIQDFILGSTSFLIFGFLFCENIEIVYTYILYNSYIWIPNFLCPPQFFPSNHNLYVICFSIKLPRSIYYLITWYMFKDYVWPCRRANFATPMRFLFGMKINVRWLFLRSKRRIFDLSANCLKNVLERGPVPGREPPPHITIVWTRCVDREEPSKDWLLKYLSVSHSLCMVQKTFITKHLLFYLYVNCLPPLWNTKPRPQTSSSFFSWRCCLRWGLQPFWWASFPGFLPCTYVTKLLFDFLLLICLSLILRPARRT